GEERFEAGDVRLHVVRVEPEEEQPRVPSIWILVINEVDDVVANTWLLREGIFETILEELSTAVEVAHDPRSELRLCNRNDVSLYYKNWICTPQVLEPQAPGRRAREAGNLSAPADRATSRRAGEGARRHTLMMPRLTIRARC